MGFRVEGAGVRVEVLRVRAGMLEVSGVLSMPREQKYPLTKEYASNSLKGVLNMIEGIFLGIGLFGCG